MTNYGIVYLSFGTNYTDCTIAALKSKIRNAPKTPAMILTNRKDDLKSTLCKKNNIEVRYVDALNTDVREYKTQIYKYSPFEHTLLLDADAWINKEMADQFKILEFAPLALTHAFHHPSIGSAAHIGAADRAYTMCQLGNLHYLPQYASGLMFFRRDDKSVRKLFDAWNTEWRVFRGKDQAALIRAILKTGVFPLVLARKDWLTPVEGTGFVSHSFGAALPSMPRKDKRSPRRNRSIL